MARPSRSTSWFTRLAWRGGIATRVMRLTLAVLAAWIWTAAGTELGGGGWQAEAQAFNAASVSGQVSTPYGGPAASAQVRVCQITAGGVPCSALAVLYSDYNLINRTPNPISTDQFGNYKAFIQAGLYLIQVTLAGGQTQPVYTYYVSAGAGGALSSPPAYSIQFASPANAGQFASDQQITINPTTHTTTSPIFFAPGGGTGLVQIGGATSGNYVTQTVDPNTGAWTFIWPTIAPTNSSQCLTASTGGVGSWVNCPLNNFLPLSGGTLTGPLIVNSTVSAQGYLYSGGGGLAGQALVSNGTQFQPGFEYPIVYDIRTFGALSNVDNTVPVQQAINAAVAAGVGGIVYIPSGVWEINGPIQSACDAIICLPAIQPTSAAQQVKIMGVSRNRQDAQGPANTSGSVITTVTTGDPASAVFGVPTVTAPFGNNIDAYFSDLTIRTYPNPQIGCINMFQAAGASIQHVRCEVGENYTGSHTQPTNIATGITLPKTGNDTLAQLEWAEISGYYQGANISEHAYLNHVWVAFGIQGYSIEPGFNTITGSDFGCEEVGLCISNIGQARINADIGIEIDPTGVFGCAAWCYTSTDIVNGSEQLSGYLHYTKSEANVGNITTPISVSPGPGGLITYYNNYTGAQSRVYAPIFTSSGSMPTCVPGTGITSCILTAGSTESRGTITITNSSATTGQILGTVNFGATLASIPICQLNQVAGVAFYGLFVGGSPTTGQFNINNINSIAGVTTITMSYSCQL